MPPEDIPRDRFDAAARSGIIPEDWLVEPVDLREVEEDLAAEWMPDHWLDEWRALVDRRRRGDALWSFAHAECEPDCELWYCRSGFALVRDGQAIGFIGWPICSW